MSNVLPQEALRDIKSNVRGRLLLAGSLVLGCCAIVAALALVPSYILLSVEMSAMSKNATDTLSAEDKADRESITHAQLLIRDLTPIASSSASVIPVLTKALSERPAGITVRSIDYERRAGGGTIVLGGSSPSREKIQAFRSALTTHPEFKSASVPLQNLTGTDSRFTLTITGTF